MRGITDGIKFSTEKAQLQYLNCHTQAKERPQSELELFSSMTDKLVNLLNYVSMINEGTLKFIEKHSPESFFQVSAHLTRIIQKLSPWYQNQPT